MYVSFRCVRTGHLRLVNLARVEFIISKGTNLTVYFNNRSESVYYNTKEDAYKMYKIILEGIQNNNKLVYDIDEKELK